MGLVWNGYNWVLPLNTDNAQQEDWLQPLPQKMPASIYRHPALGELYDHLAVQMYAVGYGELVAKALMARHHLKGRSEEHTSELQSLMRITYAVSCLKKKTFT